MEKRKNKNEGGILSSCVKTSLKSAACVFFSMLTASFVALKAEDPAKHFFICALICCGIGGVACAIFSFADLKGDVLPGSLISAAALCAAAALGSLFYDNAAVDVVHRAAPCVVLLLSAFLTALLLKAAAGKKRRRIK